MPRDLNAQARQYASRNRLIIRETLGSGIHGRVQMLQGDTTLLDVNPGNVAFGD